LHRSNFGCATFGRSYQPLRDAPLALDGNVLKGPIAGTMQRLVVSSIDRVVSAGQPLLTIVPADDAIEVKTMVANADVGFVKEGGASVVKIDACRLEIYDHLVLQWPAGAPERPQSLPPPTAPRSLERLCVRD